MQLKQFTSPFTKPVGLTLGMALSFSLAQVASAQTVTVSSIQGGSSALQGDYRPASFLPGAIPQVISQLNSGITNYKNTGQVDNFIVSTGITLRSNPGAFSETVTDAMIRYNEIAPGDIRVIVLLRSDSGQGVRYVANKMFIQDWVSENFRYRDSGGAFQPVLDAAGNGVAGAPPAAVAVAQYLIANENNATIENIDTGISDVTADSVVRYANFSNLDLAGLNGIISRRVGVITLLQLYNASLSSLPGQTSPLNFSRSNIRDLVSGDARPFGISEANIRETTSGTRITQVLSNQVTLPVTVNSPGPGFPANYLNFAFDNPTISAGDPFTNLTQNGTGNMLGRVNTSSASFGYSFVTGTAGNTRANIRVGAVDGILPYSKTGGGATDISLPNNNGQAAYGTSVYYTNVLNGQYNNWVYANSFSLPAGDPVADSLRDALNSNAPLVHQQGLLTVAELNANGVDRDFFVSDITGEQVTDGQRVVFRAGTSSPFPGNVERPVNDSKFTSQSGIPTGTINPGSQSPIQITYRNVGRTTWTEDAFYRLGTIPIDSTTFGSNRRPLPTNASVKPGESVTFSFNLQAPGQGTYNFQHRMVQDLVEFFGETTPSSTITVGPTVPPANTGTNNAEVVSVTGVPSTVKQGGRFNVVIVVKNTGTSTWTESNLYRLGTRSPQDNVFFGSNRINLQQASVAPGQNATFTFAAQAPPARPEPYVFQYQMLQETVEFFGPATSPVNIQVTQ
ncbi:MAG: hypothetical protein H7Z41_03005 [Cytophagales bacterium]|nr:hypothetical protein [Armatimonadota bacterium]